jgi:tryptophanyl-tRNA synthetase
MKIFSGIRPTGDIHIGNYLGSIKQWIELQKDNDCLFCIVDLHAITTPYEPKDLQNKIREAAISYLAAGLDPKKCILFTQSHVKEHLELFWFLNTIIPVSELQRMTQFKDKSQQHEEYVNAGLLNYPVLMASDILLYDTDVVPIGIDQKQHVELARIAARKFNNQFGQTFKEPKERILKVGAKIMSLLEPTKKMSKSGNPKGTIGLFESEESIRTKIMSATTDSGKEVKYDIDNKPGISNLLTIYSLLEGTSIPELEEKFINSSYSDFKKETAEVVIKALLPFREQKKILSKKPKYVDNILKKGTKRAEKIAKAKMKEVYSKTGF